MKKFVVIIMIIAGVAYYKWPEIMKKKDEMTLKSFKKLQTEFWNEAKDVEEKKDLEKAFERAEKGILDKSITSIEYEEIKRQMLIRVDDQKINSSDVEAIVNMIDTSIGESEAIIRR